MAEDRSLVASAVLIGAAALLPLWAAIGSGPLNGDAAAYAAQAGAGIVADRWTHLGYLGPAALIGRWGDVGLVLDAVSWVAAVIAVGAVARLAARDGRDVRLAAVLAAAVVAPWAAFGEVDLPWIAAVLLAVAGSPAWMGPAVAISPVALLALPWAVAARTDRRRELVGVAVLAVAVLTAVSGGAWWTGERGVLRSDPPTPGRTLSAVLQGLPWLVLVLAGPDGLRRLPACLPLLFAPADVPVWLVPGLAAAASVRVPGRGPVLVLVALQLVVSAGETVLRVERLRAETAEVRRIARSLGPRDGLVAPWTWGARIAVEVSGDPYGIRWHPPGRFLRDQRSAWCNDPPERARVVPSDHLWLDAAAIRSACRSPGPG